MTLDSGHYPEVNREFCATSDRAALLAAEMTTAVMLYIKDRDTAPVDLAMASIQESLAGLRFGSGSCSVVAWVSALAYQLAIIGAIATVNLELDAPHQERADVLSDLLTRAREMSEPLTEVFVL
jgi:hypothetical protein